MHVHRYAAVEARLRAAGLAGIVLLVVAERDVLSLAMREHNCTLGPDLSDTGRITHGASSLTSEPQRTPQQRAAPGIDPSTPIVTS